MVKLFLTLVCLLHGLLLANDRSYKAGEKFGQQQTQKDKKRLDGTRQVNAKRVPGFKTAEPKQSRYEDHELKDRAFHKFHGYKKNSVEEAFNETFQQRPRVYISSKDPMFLVANEAVNDPLAVLQAEEEDLETSDVFQTTSHTCQESGDAIPYVCHESRVVEAIQPPPQTKTITVTISGYGHFKLHYDCIYKYTKDLHERCSGRTPSVSVAHGLDLTKVEKILNVEFASAFEHDDSYYRAISGRDLRHKRVKWSKALKINNKGILTLNLKRHIDGRKAYDEVLKGRIAVTVTYQPKPFEVRERYVSNCQELTQKANQGICHLSDDNPDIDPKTRMVEGIAVTRDWWGTTKTYLCQHPSLNNCEVYRLQGCTQIDARCIKIVDGKCAEFEKTFECVEQTGQLKTVKVKASVYCLDGNCADQKVTANKDMAEALSKLGILQEVQKRINVKKLNLFKGDPLGCKTYVMSFRSCCDLGGGWGKTFGSTCSANEQALWNRRQQKQCVFVGTYCAEKVMGACVAERNSFCCFESKMARLLQEQGRKQLGISWGTAEEPNCRALTLDEFTKIDFTRIDLSELYAEFKAKFKLKSFDVSELKTTWQSKLPNLKSMQSGRIQRDDTMEQKIKTKREGGEDVAL